MSEYQEKDHGQYEDSAHRWAVLRGRKRLVNNPARRTFRLQASRLLDVARTIRGLRALAKKSRERAEKSLKSTWPVLSKNARQNLLDGHYLVEGRDVVVEG